MNAGAMVGGHGGSQTSGSGNLTSVSSTPHGVSETGTGGFLAQNSQVCCGMGMTSGNVSTSGYATKGHHMSAAQSSASSSASAMAVGIATASSLADGYAWSFAN